MKLTSNCLKNLVEYIKEGIMANIFKNLFVPRQIFLRIFKDLLVPRAGWHPSYNAANTS